MKNKRGFEWTIKDASERTNRNRHAGECWIAVRLSFLLLAVVLAVRPSLGQGVTTGIPPFSSETTSTFDTVNNANLNVHFAIPIFSRAGIGIPFSYALSYDGSIWTPVGTPGYQTWTAAPNFGWRGITEALAGYVSYNSSTQHCTDDNETKWYYNVFNGWAYHDAVGTPHYYSLTVTPGESHCPVSPILSATGGPSDSSGYALTATYPVNNSYVYARSGVKLNVAYYPTGGNAITDTNQNTISAVVLSNTTTFTDTLGTTALTVSAPGGGSDTTYTYPGPNGGGVYRVKYLPYTVHTNFGCASITEYGATQQYLVSEIDLPDDSTGQHDRYTFTYELTPGYSPHVTGRLASVTLPTGGTITYQYSGGSNGVTCTDGSTATLRRYTPDTGSNYWNYAHTETGSAWTTTVTDPASNQSTYNFQGIYETQRQVGSLETVVTCYNGNTSSCNTTAITSPITQITATTTLGSLQSKTNATYNSFGLPTEVDQYAFGSGAPGSLVRKTLTTYNTALNGIHIYDHVSDIQTQDGSSAIKARSSYGYDTYGNLNQETRYTVGSSTISRTLTPGSHGILTAATDFNANSTSYTSFTCNGAFPQNISSGGLTTQLVWNCDGAVITQITDPNSQPTNYSYDTTHNFWRLAGTTFPGGGSSSTTFTNPTQLDLYAATTSSLTRHDELSLDSIGRVATHSLVNDPDGQTYVNTAYDINGRTSSVSNPYRGSSNGGDSYTYDALNRVTRVTHTDASYSQITYAPTGATQACTASTYGYGYPVLYTDESGNKRQSFTDALGRTIEADEPTSTNNTPSVNTCYKYDILGNLTEVDQGSETRYFNYDLLSRPTSAQTPEAKSNTRYFYYTTSGSTLCSGDPSAVCRRTDERGITTTYTYDGLDRPTGMTYSNSDPSVSYFYDQTSYNGLTITNGSGRRTGMSDGSGQTAWSYDGMGRVVAETRTIGSITKTLGYAYNADGSLASITYPSGRTVTYTVSAVGRPTSAKDNGNNFTYVGSGNATYAPQGALASAQYGANMTFSAGYDPRLRPNLIEGSSTSAFFEVQPDYNSNGTVSGVTNLLNSARTQSFTYDYLNRITSAQSSANSGTYCWGQTIPTDGTGYDRWANLLKINVSKCTAPSLNVSVNGYNQVSNTGFSYDAAGNMLGDGGYSYTWSAEGLMKSAGTTNYTYDGDGKRVAKSIGPYYWFSPSGTILAETDTSGNTLNEYIYFSGGRTARRDSGGNVYYYFQDQIGTSRLIANAAGTVCYDAEYTPFGYEMAYATTCSQNYKFAGMERDGETGNDHTPFRGYEQNLGRWMSPDPLAGDVGNPQSLNRYTYVLNNPVTLIDPLS